MAVTIMKKGCEMMMENKTGVFAPCAANELLSPPDLGGRIAIHKHLDQQMP